jgi:hypothetical protein
LRHRSSLANGRAALRVDECCYSDDVDVRTLKAHSKARTPVPKVSKVMKRTVGALRRRAGILGVGLGHRR